MRLVKRSYLTRKIFLRGIVCKDYIPLLFAVRVSTPQKNTLACRLTSRKRNGGKTDNLKANKILRAYYFILTYTNKTDIMLPMAYQQRERARRNRFTLNNPFITDDIKVLDRENLTDEQKALLGQGVKHDFSYIRQPQFEQYFIFAIVEYDKKENKQVIGKVVSERCFFKDYNAACEYFKQIDFIRYVCFQYEKGEEGENLHLQGFMSYKRAIDFKIVKRIYPSIHLDACYGTNAEARGYCTKEKTRQEEYPFFEFGDFVEEAERTDYKQFATDSLDMTLSITELRKMYPMLTLQYLQKIKALRQEELEEKFGSIVREVKVTYIYGNTRVGKTTYPRRVLGYLPRQIAKVGKYNSTGQFDQYTMQDVIVFDEFKN